MKRLNANSRATMEKIVSESIEKGKMEYIDKVFFYSIQMRHKKTWQVNSKALSRNKKTHNMPSVFHHEGHELANSAEIPNAFNIYFANMEISIFSNWSTCC